MGAGNKLRNYQHNRIECSTINVGVSRVKMTVVEDLWLHIHNHYMNEEV